MNSLLKTYKSVLGLVIVATIMISGCSHQETALSANSTPSVSKIEHHTDADTPTSAPKKTPEQIIHFLITENNDPSQHVQQIIELLPNLNWSVYSKVNQVPADEVFSYLYTYADSITKNDYPNLIQVSSTLDGAMTETYAVIMSNIFQNHRKDLLQTLVDTDNFDVQQSVIAKIAFDLASNHIDQHQQEILNWQKKHSLTAQEKKLLQDLLKKLDHPY